MRSPFTSRPLALTVVLPVFAAMLAGIGIVYLSTKPTACEQTTIDVTSGQQPVPVELQSVSFCPYEYRGDNAMTLAGFTGVQWGKPFVAADRTFVVTSGKHYSIATAWCGSACGNTMPPARSGPVSTELPGTGCFLLKIQVTQNNGGDGSNDGYVLAVSDRSVDVSTCPLADTSTIEQP
jgi:hypothetical protein